MTAAARQPRERSENGAEVRHIDKLRHDPSSQECHLAEIPDFEDPTPADNKDSGSNT